MQPAWRSNYQSDYKGPPRLVTTSDLICWLYQVTRGMHYLSSRNILHGDLAARNILLCDDNVVKICDFGLARSMYNNNNYTKTGDVSNLFCKKMFSNLFLSVVISFFILIDFQGKLPYKWLAIESIEDRVFNSTTDVWSFGVVMWELFTLGKVPYSGLNAADSLHSKLKEGYRMEKPEYATEEM